jgi:hypothetical protein
MKTPRVDRFDANHKHRIQPEAVNLTGVPSIEQHSTNESHLPQADSDLFLELQKQLAHSPAPVPAVSHETSSPSQNTKAQADTPHAHHDAVTSVLHDVNLRVWREIIENTETHNSALRITSEERFAVEDIVNELRRKEKIKTSMNELIRLGLLFLIHDFKTNKRASLVYQVMTW